MVTRTTDYADARAPWIYFGMSTDDKPSDGPNGSAFVEIDTGIVSFYDAEGGNWHAMTSGGGDS